MTIKLNREAMLYERLEHKRVHCYLCAHHCKISPSRYGICHVRQNRDGRLDTLAYGETISANVDPIEKKPLFHFLPGSRSFSVATAGCNLQCAFCQNWQISQAARQDGDMPVSRRMDPQQIVEEAKRADCRSIAYTYTEPTIFFEYAYDTARLAKQAGIFNVFITNGYMTRQALDTIGPYLDAANVDLKSFSDAFYKRVCKARLQPVLDSIAYMKTLGIWVEVTTLLVPEENSSDEEIRRIAAFIANLSKDIPWHLSRFRPDYHFADHAVTPIDVLRKAKEIGEQNGLRYVYLGNVMETSDTICHRCQKLLVKRSLFDIDQDRLAEGKCPSCGAETAGIWR